jgi:hypothetical protein
VAMLMLSTFGIKAYFKRRRMSMDAVSYTYMSHDDKGDIVRQQGQSLVAQLTRSMSHS